jgi:hypothetical protein
MDEKQAGRLMECLEDIAVSLQRQNGLGEQAATMNDTLSKVASELHRQADIIESLSEDLSRIANKLDA